MKDPQRLVEGSAQRADAVLPQIAGQPGLDDADIRLS